MPRLVLAELTKQIDGRGPDDLVFGDGALSTCRGRSPAAGGSPGR